MRILLKIILWLVILAVIAYMVMLGVLIWKVHHVPQSEDFDAIIILGSQVLPDGTPNIQLKWRLDKALEMLKNRSVPVVVCGAKGADEPLPEAEAMRNYLMKAGIDGKLILTDPDSFNTRENLQNAARLLEGLEGYDVRKVLIVTSDYHLPRALALAEDEGFIASGVPSPTLGGWNTVRNYGRETIAWMKYLTEKLFGIEIHNSNFDIHHITRQNDD